MNLLSIITLLATLTLATAITAPSCTTITPSIARVDAARPVKLYLLGFWVSQEASSTKKQDTFAKFTTPPGVWVCTLSYYFPPETLVTTTSLALVEVFSVATPVRIVGSVKFKLDARVPTSQVINSFVCKRNMVYYLSILQGHSQKTSVEFGQSVGVVLRMSYTC
ncbi:hypothetical protein BJY00DRAFT_306335 [Aspergillus carlsbadensis]|nr:hypothetical protein BJY00DRAFT_306335 [Aspergillus carlsbadensis]